MKPSDVECAKPPRRLARPRIAVAAEPRYLAQAQPAGLSGALCRLGHPATVLDPQDPRTLDLSGLDLLIARGRSEALLDLLDRAECMGIATINKREAILSVVDKARMGRALAMAGLPIPPTRHDSIAALLDHSSDEDFPMVVKPIYGDNARDVRIIYNRDQLAALEWVEPTALAQPLIPSDGFDLKLYVAGDEVHAARKPSPLSPQAGLAAQPAPMTAELRTLALRCGKVFGLDFYGVDCIQTAGGPLVIEVNDFPNYSAVPGADECLARYAIRCAQRAHEEKAR
ncbi:MAG TPA: ATP-grasp domain-containing protein [Myxococcales bacterium]